MISVIVFNRISKFVNSVNKITWNLLCHSPLQKFPCSLLGCFAEFYVIYRGPMSSKILYLLISNMRPNNAVIAQSLIVFMGRNSQVLWQHIIDWCLFGDRHKNFMRLRCLVYRLEKWNSFICMWKKRICSSSTTPMI